MTDFSSPAVGLTLNNTGVFGEQAPWSDRAHRPRRPGVRHTAAILAFAVLALSGSGCRSVKKAAPEAGKAGASGSAIDRLTVAPPPPLEAASLPNPDALAARPPASSRPGGVLRVHLENEPPHLNPLLDADVAISNVVGGLIYQPLIECTPGAYRPGLAERWETSPDGLRIYLHMRPGVRWHDHHAFTVVDAQATLERVIRSNSALPLVRADLADLTTVEITGDHVIRLDLRRPSDLVLRALCDVPILPEHLSKPGSPEAAALARQPVGTGPFRFLAWERGKRIRLGRFAEGWGPGPAPLVDEIVFDLEPDAVRALNRARRGDIDILPRVLDSHYPDQVEPATLHGTVTLYRLTPERSSFLVVNHRRFPLGDPRFRRALSMLWDRARFAREAHKDLARPIGGPLFAAPGAALPPAFDRKAAAAALDDAGYRDNDADGVRDRGGRPIRLTLLQPTGGKTVALEAHAFTLELRKVGILLDVVPADPATILARLKKGDFDLAPMVWQGSVDEDPTQLFAADGIYNFGGYRSAEVDALLDELRVAPGPEARRPVLQKLGRLLADDQPVIFLYRHDVPALISNRVQDLAATGDRLDYRRVWLAAP
jgi:peptide/nickel transport system substrate-binding protein